MLSKLSRNLRSEISESLGLQICNNISMEKMALTHRTRDEARNANLKIVSPSRMQRRVTGRQRRTLESGVIFTKAPSTKLMNVARNNQWFTKVRPVEPDAQRVLVEPKKDAYESVEN